MSKFFIPLFFVSFSFLSAPDELYKNDYKCALIVHSFSWAFSIMLPILIMNWAAIMASNMLMLAVLCIFSANVLLHALTDNAKANLKIISLCYDQGFHMPSPAPFRITGIE